MKVERILIVVLIVIAIGVNACNPSTASPETQQGDDVATMVAATLTGIANQQPSATKPEEEIATEEQPPVETTQSPPLEQTEPPPVHTTPPPQGLKTVYSFANQVWVWVEGSGVQKLYEGEEVSRVLISPDGELVAFTTLDASGYESNLWAVNWDGSNLRRLIDTATFNEMNTNPSAIGAGPGNVDFVPGTHTLAFNTSLHFEGPGLILQNDLRLIDLDNGNLRLLLGVGQGGDFYYSPDGSLIALVTPTQIDLITSDGAQRHNAVFSYPSVITYSEYQFYAPVIWSKDGGEMVVLVPSEDPFLPDASISVWKIAVNNLAPQAMGTFTTDVGVFNTSSLLSPDLSRVAYLKRVGAIGDNTWELHIYTFATAQDVVYHTGKIRFQGWSPDGQWFVWEEDDDLFMGQLNGGIWPLADHPPAQTVAWVDSGRFIYLSGGRGSWDLRLGSFSQPSISLAVINADFVDFDFAPKP